MNEIRERQCSMPEMWNNFQVDEQNNYIEYLYIQAKCPCCDHENYMLNIGKDILDKYTYYNAVMDERYYRY